MVKEAIPDLGTAVNDQLEVHVDQVERHKGLCVFSLVGSIDTYNSSFFQDKINLAIEAGYVNLVFDMSEIKYVSSTGIGAFTSFLKSIAPSKGEIIFLHMQPKVLDVFQLLGFSSFFTFKKSLDSAVSSFVSKKMEREIFPVVFTCPVCARKLRAQKPGRFRCPDCKTILAIENTGIIFQL